MLGIGDAGAHCGQIQDASQSTYLLTRWVRDGGRWSVEQGIKMLTSEGADLFGLEGRGRLVEGAYADINVIDFEGLELQAPEYVYDFPNGAGRWIQKAERLRPHHGERRRVHARRRAPGRPRRSRAPQLIPTTSE